MHLIVLLITYYHKNNENSVLLYFIVFYYMYLLFLGNSNSVGIQQDVNTVVTAMDGKNSQIKLANCSNNNDKKLKQRKTSGKSGVLTAADMYEPGFRIKNSGLCSAQTRLLILITSAAAPSHSQHRQAIRMTWLNRYGPSVSMAFLVGTPLMSKTDPVAKVLEAEERELRIRLSGISIDNNIDPKETLKPHASSDTADTILNPPDGDLKWHRFMRDSEPNIEEGLDAHAMHGLNKAEQTVQRVLGREQSRYRDLIECKVRDTYTNLTLKSIAALEWTRQYCPWARYLLKTDDDMFIDVRRLLRFIDKVEIDAIKETSLNGLSTHVHKSIHADSLINTNIDVFESASTSNFDIELPPMIWGRLAHGWRPIRQHNSKYYVSRMQYAGRVYPDFCTGPAYLMTRSTIGPLYEGALGHDFDIVDDYDDQETKNYKGNDDNKYLKKDCGDGNQTLVVDGVNVPTGDGNSGKNTVPYLKLEDVYLTGVVAERLTRRAAERLARQMLKDKKNSIDSGDHSQKTSAKKSSAVDPEHLDSNKNTKLKISDIIVKVRRINDDQFANKKITGRALDRALCNDASPSYTAGSSGSGFSWFRWYWGDTAVDKDSKKKKKDQGVISLHMVKYFEQFDLWRRLMDGRTKCKP